MKKTVIYTCIIGAYDDLLQPAVPASDFDFVCFVGKGEKTADRIGVWEIREFDCGLSDCRLMSRYPKMHPHVLLPEYETSVWVDGNIQLLDGSIYDAAREKAASGILYSGVPHPSRDCTYEEALICHRLGYVGCFGLAKIWIWLRMHGLPANYGLMENNLIFRRHMDPLIVKFDEFWWARLFDVSFRDQLSFMVGLRKFGIEPDRSLLGGLNTRNHPGFKYLRHK